MGQEVSDFAVVTLLVVYSITFGFIMFCLGQAWDDPTWGSTEDDGGGTTCPDYPPDDLVPFDQDDNASR